MSDKFTHMIADIFMTLMNVYSQCSVCRYAFHIIVFANLLYRAYHHYHYLSYSSNSPTISTYPYNVIGREARSQAIEIYERKRLMVKNLVFALSEIRASNPLRRSLDDWLFTRDSTVRRRRRRRRRQYLTTTVFWRSLDDCIFMLVRRRDDDDDDEDILRSPRL